MTKEQKIEAIRQACIKVNPSILDLKFGCEIAVFGDRGIFLSSFLRSYYVQFGSSSIPQSLISIENTIEIIGRPIELADILMLPDTEEMKMAPQIGNALALYGFLARKWRLSLPFIEQPEETIDFIYEIIK